MTTAAIYANHFLSIDILKAGAFIQSDQTWIVLVV